jgi:starch synthase
VDPRFAIVIAAGSADEPVIGAEVEQLISELQKSRSNVHWIKEMLPHDELVALLTAAQVFACPSIYEPLGIVNLEAMACETAVVASSVGGIPEVVSDGETGYLVKLSQDSSQFEAEFADALNKVLSDESLAQKLGAAGRNRVVAEFGWDKVARTTIDLYRSLI